MMYEVKNKVFLVTGGASGIGEWTVKAFLEEGAKHVAILDLNDEVGTALEKQLAEKYGVDKVKFHKCDVTTDQLLEAYNQVLHQMGYIDVVVNNAGILDDSAYERCIAINLTAVIKSSFKAYEIMRKDKEGTGGTIVNIASIAALGLGTSSVPVYNTTKAAVLRFSVNLGNESNYAVSGVRVVTICFGVTDTAIFAAPRAFTESANTELFNIIANSTAQTPQNAALGLVHALKHGISASTWLVADNLPAKDITGDVTEAHDVLARTLIS